MLCGEVDTGCGQRQEEGGRETGELGQRLPLLGKVHILFLSLP